MSGTMRRWMFLALSAVLAAADRYADTAALYQALGGGWWNRNEVSEQ